MSSNKTAPRPTKEENAAANQRLGALLRECMRHRGVLQRRIHDHTQLVDCGDIANGWVGSTWKMEMNMTMRDGREVIFGDDGRPVAQAEEQIQWYRRSDEPQPKGE